MKLSTMQIVSSNNRIILLCFIFIPFGIRIPFRRRKKCQTSVELDFAKIKCILWHAVVIGFDFVLNF